MRNVRRSPSTSGLACLAAVVFTACPAPEAAPVDADRDGFLSNDDCDDADPFVYPGALERCNGRDDDCDGQIDGPSASASTLWYVDEDGDGFGEPDSAVRACEALAGRIPQGEDCDDSDPDVHPGVVDRCDGIDSDCDGVVDDNPDTQAYLDLDGDGHGGPSLGWGCVGAGATAEPTDCNDDDPAVFPGAEERCNEGIDDDCDGRADDLDLEGVVDPSVWYADVDLDGFGDPDQVAWACLPPTGNVAAVDGDCDDGDDATYPGAFEGCAPIDRDCDGNLPDAEAWWSTAWPSRIPLEVSSAVDRDAPVISITLDVGAAAGIGFDPRAVALVVQDCAGEGAVRLDAQFTDGLGSVFDGADLLPLDDGIGGLHAVLDRPLTAGEVLPLALYVNGPIASVPGDATASVDALSNGRVSATFDRVEGGLLEVSVDALAADATVVDGRVSSAAPSGATGPRGGSGTLHYGLATTEVVHHDGMVAALDVTTPFEPIGAGDAAVDQHIRWVAFSGRPELYGWVTTYVVVDGAVGGLSSLGLGAGALRGQAVATDHAGSFGSWSSPQGHVAFGWVDPPLENVSIATNDDVLVLGGADVPLPALLQATGAPLIDRRLLVVRADAGPVDDEATAEALAPRLDIVVGAPETP